MGSMGILYSYTPKPYSIYLRGTIGVGCRVKQGISQGMGGDCDGILGFPFMDHGGFRNSEMDMASPRQNESYGLAAWV